MRSDTQPPASRGRRIEVLGSVWRLVGPLGALGRRSSLLFGPRGSTLGSRVELGAISGAVLGPVGVILAPLWLHIGILGGSWADFGPIWAPLGAHLATLWPLLAPFGPLLGALGPRFGHFWLHLGHLWGPFGSKNEGQTKKEKKNKNGGQKRPLMEFLGVKK